MKHFAMASIALLAVMTGFFAFSSLNKINGHALSDAERYNKWRAEFNKLYATPSEASFRMNLVVNKLNQIDSWNAEYEAAIEADGLPPLKGPMFAPKMWADLTQEEFKKKYAGLNVEGKKSDVIHESLGYELPAPEANMLGQTGFNPVVRDQGDCGSCWAFSTIATTEAFYYQIKKVHINLSQQELVDCDTQGGNGCEGGWPTDSYWYIVDNGIQNAASYPYKANRLSCSTDATKKIWFDDFYTSREVKFTATAALNAYSRGIVGGLAVHSANKFAYLSDTEDIYDAMKSGECAGSIDHAVNLFSAGRDAKGRFFVRILNSWSTSWGIGGHKKVYPCGAASLWGIPSIISYASNVAI